MARKRRVELEGGLYHLIARGNDRQDIFHEPEVETVLRIPRDAFCGSGKVSHALRAKELFILCAAEAGATAAQISNILNLDNSASAAG